ncbi:hypothetical protein FRC03_006284 [Tulasnella sp. 419]|nr:hypothetical protein FRC03_006284 [Tulasnella sp. 419]
MLLSQFGLMLFVSLVTAKAHHPRSSPGLCVEQSCPEKDLGDFALDSNAPNQTGNPGLYCDYPANPEEYGDYYCIYDPSTGNLTTDNNLGACPPNATSHQTACGRKRSPKSSPPDVASEPKPASRRMIKRVQPDGKKKKQL